MMNAIEIISDWHLPLSGPKLGVVYPGGGPVEGHEVLFAEKLLAAAREEAVIKKSSSGEETPDFRVDVEEISFRCHFEKTIEGGWLLFRKITDTVPKIEALIRANIRQLLLHEKLLAGGLVVVAGAAGEGKSTTCAATVAGRLEKFGGICWTIEDPAEFPLNGPHGGGVCHQTELGPDQSLAAAIKEKKRAFPAKTPGILMLGEVRDAAAIEQALQAALSGLLVVVTLHANDIPSAITRIINAGGGGGTHWRNIVAQALKIVIHQRFQGEKMTFESVVVDGDTSIVGNFIKEDKVRMISGDIDMQARHLALGKPLFRKVERA